MEKITINRRIRGGIIVVCLGLLIAGGWSLGKIRSGPALPAPARYAALPEKFNELLQRAHEQIRSSGRNPAEVRKLARLYQANRLYPQARFCYPVIAATSAGLNAIITTSPISRRMRATLHGLRPSCARWK